MHRTIYYCHIKNIAVEVIIRLKMDNTEREEKKKEYSGDIIFKTSIIQVVL